MLTDVFIAWLVNKPHVIIIQVAITNKSNIFRMGPMFKHKCLCMYAW